MGKARSDTPLPPSSHFHLSPLSSIAFDPKDGMWMNASLSLSLSLSPSPSLFLSLFLHRAFRRSFLRMLVLDSFSEFNRRTVGSDPFVRSSTCSLARFSPPRVCFAPFSFLLSATIRHGLKSCDRRRQPCDIGFMSHISEASNHRPRPRTAKARRNRPPQRERAAFGSPALL